MMKIEDVKIATALIISGYIRTESDIDEAIKTAVGAIQRECAEWLDETRSAIDEAEIEVELNGPRTPYNIRSAMKALADELIGLDGAEAIISFEPVT